MTNQRVGELDLLRFLAALAVVFFHYAFRGVAADNMSVMPYPMLESVSKYGYLGVHLFFMISGFVILMTAAGGSIRTFLISRVTRLYPAFWACCTITFLVTLAFGGSRYSATFGQYIVNMTMLSGFVGVPSIDGAYWSLYVELQFYALVALVLAMGRIQHAQLFIVVWLALSVALEIRPVSKLNRLFITNFSAFFIAGTTCFIIWSKGISPVRAMIVAIAWVLAVYQSVAALGDFEAHYRTSMNGYVVSGIVTTFFIVMLLIALKRSGPFGRRRWMLMGALTYPLYLLHQYIGFMIFNAAYPAFDAHFLFWGTIVAALASAYMVHRFVERPLAPRLKVALGSLADRVQKIVSGPEQQSE